MKGNIPPVDLDLPVDLDFPVDLEPVMQKLGNSILLNLALRKTYHWQSGRAAEGALVPKLVIINIKYGTHPAVAN